MEKGQLDIYKASAGSGKTHTLAHKYIDILLSKNADTEAYKHILAVTFTNKATEEMKGRIVSILYKLSQGKGEELEKLSPAEAAEVKARAKTILTAILHDYSNFQVTTIDKFFQQIFRSFARELGSFTNYRVELSDEDVLTHAIDEMLSRLDDASAPDAETIFKIINSFALDQWRYSSKSQYTEQLLSFAKLFIKEDFKTKAGDYKSDFARIDNAGKKAADYAAAFEDKLKSLAEEAILAIKGQGLDLTDFKGGSRGVMQKLPAYAKGEMPLLTDGQKEMFLGSPDGWFSKDKQAAHKIALAQAACNRPGKPGLDDLLRQIVELFGEPYAQYRTAAIIRTNLGVMKIFGGIHDSLLRYLKENNIMLLGETTHALNKMIAGSDTPFIYERIGSWLDNYLLDEFQDFSLMQWDNFKPLLEQSLDTGGDNLIVGDVKQSIYRWRGSDWSTLQRGVEEQLSGKSLDIKSLGDNWRSDRVIVDFNNEFFAAITNKDNGSFKGDETIAQVYSDCVQTPVKAGGGHVKVTFWEGKDESDDPACLAMLKDEVERLTDLGYPRSDIYFLVRTNREASAVAARLIADDIDVITDESLVVGASGYVQRIVAVLKYLINAQDPVNAQVVAEMGLDKAILNPEGNSLYDICENVVRALGEDLLDGQMPYLMTFMDLVLDYMRDYGSDIAGFIKWWGETGCKQTISAPKGADAVRIMTIHKAKGLGCPVVILPFFHEQLTPKMTNYMWCSETEHFDAGLMPVEFKKEVGETTFGGDYSREALYYKMDALNTAYVAFTRAKHELIVFARIKNKKPGISDMLYEMYSPLAEDNVYEIGESCSYKAEDDESAKVTRRPLPGYNSIPMEGTAGKKRLALVFRGSEFFEEGAQSARARGIVLHDILSSINSVADIPAAVKAAVDGGELESAKAQETVQMVQQMLSEVAGYGWFSSDWDTLNEASIIDTDGKLYRPDRVLTRGSRAVVIDYKFGTSHSGYQRQVRNYMALLREMGFEEVEGYLWYAAEHKIEKV